MRLSRLSIPFLLQTPTAGGADAWKTIGAMWGALEETRDGSRAVRVDRATHVITIRQRRDIDLLVGMRMVFEVRRFLIVAIHPDEDEKRWMRLSVQEITTIH